VFAVQLARIAGARTDNGNGTAPAPA